MGLRNLTSALKSGQVLVFVFVTLLLSIGAFAGGAGANDKVLVSIFADGQKQTIATEAATVADVLATAEVDLHPKDLVEPARKTQIDSDVFKINVYRARPYTIIDGKKEIDVLSAYQSPRLIAENSGVKVFPEDKFDIDRIDNIVNEQMLGQKIRIIRAVPVNLHIYGEKVVHRTHEKTVGDVLAEKEISLNEEDIVAPGAAEKVKRGMDIHILSVGNSVQAVEEPIPYPTEKIYDSSIDAGQSTVKQAGVDGQRVVTYEIVLHNGAEAGRNELQSVTIKEPTPEILIVGTKSANPGSNIAVGQELAASVGWTGAEWGCLYELWLHESGWNHLTSNYGGSGAYGIPQALPGSKMSAAGADWETNPRTQIRWGISYITGRYGTPCAAQGHASSTGWY